jgi:RimJ/RimL family protein N-acetyltransferase
MQDLQIMKLLFSRKVKQNEITFKRDLRPQIIVYKWEEGIAYSSPFKLFSSTMRSIDEMCSYISFKHPEFVKRKEYYMFANSLHYINNNNLVLRPLKYNDEDALEKLKESCSKTENEVAHISIYDPNIIGAFYNNKLVGVCCMDLYKGIYDIAVLVHSEYRNQKIASSLIYYNAKKALDERGICMYRVDDFNIASMHAAKNVGFKTRIEVLFYELEENQ